MNRNFRAGIALVAMTAATSASALPQGFKAEADALLARSYPADGPGASVAISQSGKIVYEGHRGLADIPAQRAISAGTVFRIGSITKQISAAVLLQLVAEGKVGLDDPLAKYLPTYPNGSAITMRELLNHTSGIQSYTSIPGWMVEARTNKAYTTEAMIAEFAQLPATSKPGEAWSYNNSGYVLVGAVIEAVTHRPWYDEVNRRIAAPLGLHSLRYGVDEPQITAMAKGYTEGDDKTVTLANRIHMSVPAAAGALAATATDVTRWGHALHHGEIVAAPFYQQMIAPTKLPNGTVAPYGFGLETGTLRGLATIGHSGGIFGFASDSIYVPQDDVFVTVLTNSDHPHTSAGTVMRRLAAMAVGKAYPVFTQKPLDARSLDPFVGTYKLDDKDRILRVEDGKLLYVRPEGATSELVPVGAGRYAFGLDTVSWIELKRDVAGKPTMTVYVDGEDVDGPASRVGPVPPVAPDFTVPAATLKRYVGNYTSPVGKIVVAAEPGDILTFKLASQAAIRLHATSATDFDVERVGAKVHFVDEGGAIKRLELTQGGRTLPATRD
jgi:CubicO group peptidase (beta-lactamase class C family)